MNDIFKWKIQEYMSSSLFGFLNEKVERKGKMKMKWGGWMSGRNTKNEK